MPRPRQGLTACGVLLAVLLACALVRSRLVELVALPFVVGLFATEVDRSGGLIAVRILKMAGWLLPRHAREPNLNEWTDHVLSAGEAGLRPVLDAIGIALWAAPRVAVRLRARPLVGRYLLGLVGAAYSVMTAHPRRSGPELWRMAQAFARMPAFFAVPLLAPLVLRTKSRTLVRRLSYPIGIAGWLGIGSVTQAAGGWWLQQLVPLIVPLVTLVGWAAVFQNSDALIAFAYRVAGVIKDD